MAVVKVDERGRLTIPSKFQVRGTRAALIPAGSFLIVVPIPSEPLEASASWLATELSRKALKTLAEEAAHRDALKRARRRERRGSLFIPVLSKRDRGDRGGSE